MDEQRPSGLVERALLVLERAGIFLVPLLLLGAAAYFARFVHGFYPIQQWLFWRYAGYWLLCALWSAACLSVGHLTLHRLLRRPLPLLEHLATSFAVGVFEFSTAMNLAGFFKLYNVALFVALPLVLLGAGFLPLKRYLTRALRHLRFRRARAAPAPLWTYAALAFGLLGSCMVYFLILTPDNIQFDARWKHLALAEDYVATGGIRRFPEGSTVETYPHLATFLYTWAFLLPRGLLFDKVELAAHMEFFGFLFTTVLGIPAAVRRLAPRALGPHALQVSWAARFLFPGVFLYDSTLSGGGDHVGAIFALPAFTLLLRSYEALSPRFIALLMMMLAGGGLTKLTGAILLLPFPALALGLRAVVLAVLSLRGKAAPALRRSWYLGPLAAIGLGLLYTAPHWAKNWIYYGDPLYPTLHKHLALHPWTQDAADLFEWGYKDFQFWRPARNTSGVIQTLHALWDFSLVPNDWERFHGKVPVFGSLFTLLLLCLPFFRGTKRLWALVGYVQLAILAWYWTHHQDRYLQTLVPQMAVVTAVIIGLLFQQAGRSRLVAAATRVAASVLIGLQIVWGGDVYFIPTHAMITSPIKAVVDLLGTGYAKRYQQRYDVYPTFQSIARALPEGARLLLHDNHVHLGVGAESVSDWGGWQFGISYGRQRSPREVWELLHGMGVTHVAWDNQGSKGWDSVAGDIVFFDFALQHTVKPARHGGMVLATMGPAPAPDAKLPSPVAYLGCNDAYRSGLYELADLTVPVFGPKSRAYPPPRRPAPPKGESIEALLGEAAAVVLDPKCQSLSDAQSGSFTLAAKRRVVRGKRGTLKIYLRTTGVASGAPLGPPPASPAGAAPSGEPDTPPEGNLDSSEPADSSDNPG
jgi:hypothetical protein